MGKIIVTKQNLEELCVDEVTLIEFCQRFPQEEFEVNEKVIFDNYNFLSRVFSGFEYFIPHDQQFEYEFVRLQEEGVVSSDENPYAHITRQQELAVEFKSKVLIEFLKLKYKRYI